MPISLIAEIPGINLSRSDVGAAQAHQIPALEA
jgi:hypothetical protein